MDLFVDENLPKLIVDWFREAGFDVLYACETAIGMDDAKWIERCNLEHRLIISADIDFGELVFRDGWNCRGIVLLRLDNLSAGEQLGRIKEAWSIVEANSIKRFIVIDESKVRVRAMPDGD